MIRRSSLPCAVEVGAQVFFGHADELLFASTHPMVMKTMMLDQAAHGPGRYVHRAGDLVDREQFRVVSLSGHEISSRLASQWVGTTWPDQLWIRIRSAERPAANRGIGIARHDRVRDLRNGKTDGQEEPAGHARILLSRRARP